MLMQNKLSVIIVSYNVKYYIDQCLRSALRAAENLEVEIWVVDNNSTDDTVEHVKKHFPKVNIIANKDNKGFSRANNQAIAASNADYILLLNPDTVVGEDTFAKSIHFFDTTPNCGGLTVKMVDGEGNFLPESKRGLPTPQVAFNKIFGLSSLFPKSKNFGKYHLGFLPENEINEIDVLSGAYMMMRHKTLEVSGLLDENFFMYGEDIDLSYRINLSGYKNYYFPHTYIIHYKGESTKKSSINYVFVFYRAMIIFSEKHFAKRFNRIFSALINIAIYLRAGLAILNRFFINNRFVIRDLIFTVLLYLQFSNDILTITKFATVTAVFLFLQFIQANYYISEKRFIRIYTFTLYFLSIIYFSNLVIDKYIFISFFKFICSYLLLEVFLTKIIKDEKAKLEDLYKRVLIVSNAPADYEKIFSIINQDERFIDEQIKFSTFADTIKLKTKELQKYSDIIFSTNQLAFEQIIMQCEKWRFLKTEFKIYNFELSYITSTSAVRIHNVYKKPVFNLQVYQHVQQWFLNFILSLIVIIASPVLVFTTKSYIIKTAFHFLLGKERFTLQSVNGNALFTPEKMIKMPRDIEKIREVYFKNYNIKNDISLIYHLVFTH